MQQWDTLILVTVFANTIEKFSYTRLETEVCMFIYWRFYEKKTSVGSVDNFVVNFSEY